MVAKIVKPQFYLILIPHYIIEGNTQTAALGKSWQDGVNALLML